MNLRVSEIETQLKKLGKRKNVEGMARYGIVSRNVYGVSTKVLWKMSRRIGKDQKFSLELWKSGSFEARLLALLVAEPARVTERQMERWVKDFDNWAVCDGCCLHLFRMTPWAHQKARQWSRRREEFVKRAGYVMIATLAVHDKQADDSAFRRYLADVVRGAKDERTYVKKAVNWALRQIGKRNLRLNKAAMRTGKRISAIDSPAARWIASDALRELRSPAVQRRLQRATHRAKRKSNRRRS